MRRVSKIAQRITSGMTVLHMCVPASVRCAVPCQVRISRVHVVYEDADIAREAPVKRAVILAAGDGGRLGMRTRALPKALVPVAGKPLIQYTLEALAEAGVAEAVVVTGHREEQLRAALSDGGVSPRLRFVSNDRFSAGASLSLRAARALTGSEPFLLVMADHLLSTELLRRLLRSARPGMSFVAADFRPAAHHDVDEATRIRLAAGTRVVTAIGKHVAPFDALDAGAFLIDPSAWRALDAAPEDTDLSTVFGELVAGRALSAADISGTFWFDVDTEADLEAAEELITRRTARGVA